SLDTRMGSSRRGQAGTRARSTAIPARRVARNRKDERYQIINRFKDFEEFLNRLYWSNMSVATCCPRGAIRRRGACRTRNNAGLRGIAPVAPRRGMPHFVPSLSATSPSNKEKGHPHM